MTGAAGRDDGLAVTAARGVLWTGGGQVLRQLIQIGGTLALVRLLAPEEFGLLGMAMFFVGLGQLLADFGFGTAIVQSRTDDQSVLSTCFWLNLAISATAAVGVTLAAPLVASFYGRHEVAAVVAVLSANLVLGALQVVPMALLARDLRFAHVMRAQVCGAAAGAAAAIALAASGLGIWSLVAQPLVGSAITLLVATASTGWLPRLHFSWAAVAPLARFSAALLGTNLVNYANRNVDALLVGRVLGAGALGHYATAIQIMLFPLQHVSSVFVRVLFPTLSHVRDQPARLRSAYLRTVGGIALLTFPLMGGLFALAHDFVLVVFGARWLPMVPVIEVLAWVGMMQSIGTTVGTIYMAMGRADIALRVTLVAAPVIIGSLAAGLPWGIRGVALGYAAATFALFFYTLVPAFRLVDLRLGDFLREIARPLVCTLGMVAVLLVVPLPAWFEPAPLRLACGAALGALVYGVLSLLVNGTQLTEITRLLRRSMHAGKTSS